MSKGLQLFLCALAIGVAHAKPGFLHGGLHGVAYAAPAVSVSSQHHAQDTLGQYSYGYSGDTSAKTETRTADGITRGGYSYLDSYGLVQSASYVSDPVNGFRVAASNLPVHVPAPVHDTPEVAAAKSAHAVAYNQAAAAAAAAPDVPGPVAIAAPAIYAAAAPAVYAAAAPAVYAAPAPAVYAAAAPAVVASHGYTAPGIVASANTAGGFAYSTQSVGPAYAPHYYNAAVPAVHAAPAVYAAAAPAVYAAPAPAVYAAAAPAVVASHGYTAPGIVANANTAGGFAYSAQSVGPAYAPHYYNAVHAVPAVHAVHAAPVLVNGVPADTPAVAAAKSAHYAAHVEEKLRHFG